MALPSFSNRYTAKLDGAFLGYGTDGTGDEQGKEGLGVVGADL